MAQETKPLNGSRPGGSADQDKPKVLMLLANPFLPDLRVLREARSLSRRYQVTVLAFDHTGRQPRREVIGGVRIERVSPVLLRTLGPLLQKLHLTLLFGLPLFYLAALRWLFQDFRLVHCHDLDTLPLGVLLGKLKRAKLIFDAHEDFPAMIGFRRGSLTRRLFFRLERLLMRRVDAVLVVGEIMKEEYQRRTNRPIYLVGNWKDAQDFQERPELIHPKAIEAKAQGKLIVSYLAGINATRVILPLLEAAQDDPDAFVLIVGGRAGNPVARPIEHTAAELPNALYLGWLSPEELEAYFAFTDAVYYCLQPEAPNNRYSASNTVFSSLAAGKAVITTEIGEVGHIVKDRRCGIVMREATKEEILKAFAQLKERACLERLQRNALQTAGDYSWRRAEETLLELYGGLL